jgi:hypothetical protein
MPIHDWTRVDAGLFHAFHHRWIDALCDALNGGVLPADYFALPEQGIQGPIPDVLTLKLGGAGEEAGESVTGHAVATAPPRARLVRTSEAEIYARQANRITVRHRHGDVVAVIEIVSPGNKASRAEFRRFLEKSADLIRQGIHLLVVDLFPPGKRDPEGMVKAIWDEFADDTFDLPVDKPLHLGAFDAGAMTVYGEAVAPGDVLPDMAVFLKAGIYVQAPLEATYETSWAVFPAPLKSLLESS